MNINNDSRIEHDGFDNEYVEGIMANENEGVIGNIVFNINHNVEVVLTDIGADIANRIDASRNVLRRPWQAGDIYRDQMWNIMKTFGHSIRMWETPFKTDIRLIDEDRIGRKLLKYNASNRRHT